MNNFASRFYFFTKLTTSLILFLLLILLSYLFVKAYLKEKGPNSSNFKFEELSNQISNLTNIVEQNSNSLNNVKGFVQNNKKSVNDIILSLETLNDNKINDNLLIQIDKLFEENNKLKDELYNISSMINNLENFNKPIKKSENLYVPVDNIVKLIRLKLDNGSNFSEEVELLKDLKLNAGYISNVEKLSIYATNNFPGIDKLSTNFDQISSQYLNDYYLKKSNTHFIKYFINFITIQPNLNDDVEDETVLLLSLAKQNFLNKNLIVTIKKLDSLNDEKSLFTTWIEQAKYYEQVTDLLNKL